jgi:hypothetical protein
LARPLPCSQRETLGPRLKTPKRRCSETLVTHRFAPDLHNTQHVWLPPAGLDASVLPVPVLPCIALCLFSSFFDRLCPCHCHCHCLAPHQPAACHLNLDSICDLLGAPLEHSGSSVKLMRFSGCSSKPRRRHICTSPPSAKRIRPSTAHCGPHRARIHYIWDLKDVCRAS